MLSGAGLQDYGFTGREFDDETGLYYYRARHYDPDPGRFLQSDPLGFAAGDVNLYSYTYNDPANWADPSGLKGSGGVARLSAGVVGIAKVATSKVGRGALCLAGKVSSALQQLGMLLDYGLTFDKITEFGSRGAAACRTRIKANDNEKKGCDCSGSGGSTSSFPVGTEVLTPKGKVAIESLREGDLIVARNEETGQSGIFPIIALMSRQATDVVLLTLENQFGQTSRMGVTSAHPLFTVGVGWLSADKLVPGDLVRGSDLKELKVVAVKIDRSPQQVHNLEVADAHTYFAGEFEAWGHNNKIRDIGNRLVCTVKTFAPDLFTGGVFGYDDASARKAKYKPYPDSPSGRTGYRCAYFYRLGTRLFGLDVE